MIDRPTSRALLRENDYYTVFRKEEEYVTYTTENCRTHRYLFLFRDNITGYTLFIKCNFVSVSKIKI